MAHLAEIQTLIDEALAKVRTDSQYHLPPTLRLSIYQKIGLPTEPAPLVNSMRGRLGIMTARRVLPVWQSATPIRTEIPKGLPNDKYLADGLLELAEGVLNGTGEIAPAWKEVNDSWYVVGNIGDEFTALRDDKPLSVYYACDAAMRAFYETLGVEFLSKTKKLEQYSDDNLPDEIRDSASSAVIAFAGGAETEPTDLPKRLEFWEWWLKDAIPTVCE